MRDGRTCKGFGIFRRRQTRCVRVSFHEPVGRHVRLQDGEGRLTFPGSRHRVPSQSLVPVPRDEAKAIIRRQEQVVVVTVAGERVVVGQPCVDRQEAEEAIHVHGPARYPAKDASSVLVSSCRMDTNLAASDSETVDLGS